MCIEQQHAPGGRRSMNVTKSEIETGLRNIGVEAGDRLIVHSSLSSIGWVEGGADTVVDALLSVVGTDGTIMMPTFTPSTSPGEPFDPSTTPSETGAVTEALRERSEAFRSRHPTHSIAVIGQGAEDFSGEHELMESLGPDSPMHRLIERGGDILLIGVDHTKNSAIHIAEKLTEVPYRDQTRWTGMVDESGTPEPVEANIAHCSYGFGKIESLAKRIEGVITYGYIGEAESQLIDGQKFLSLSTEVLEEEPGLVLCDDPDCDRCQYARRTITESR